MGRSCGFERRFAGGVLGLFGLGGVLGPAGLGGVLGPAGLGGASGASAAGSFAYESVCRRAGAVGAGCAGESNVL